MSEFADFENFSCTKSPILNHDGLTIKGKNALQKLFVGQTPQMFAKKDLIACENQFAPAVFCLFSGKVKLWQKGYNQKEHILKLGKPGVLFG